MSRTGGTQDRRRPHARSRHIYVIFQAVWLAWDTIRVQKLKSFFTVIGVTIGVTFLIAVVSIVGGMSRYMKRPRRQADRRQLFQLGRVRIFRLGRDPSAAKRVAAPPAHSRGGHPSGCRFFGAWCSVGRREQ
jgi:hypothetical protein